VWKKISKFLQCPASKPLVLSSKSNRQTEQPDMNATANHYKSEAQKPDLLAVGETISFWFAISSPLTAIVIGFLGAWFFTWLTS
jgi:hypothetical protein